MDSFPFCPNPHCSWHTLSPPSQWLRCKGFYSTKAFGRVKRFQCKACGTTFSSQTFSLSYYVKKGSAWPISPSACPQAKASEQWGGT